MAIAKDQMFELLWSFAYLSVHRYGGSPSGEVLMVLTILMLDQAGEHVTMSELAQITGLPKSNVSRYVSDQVRIGHLQEHVDPRDRRRRVLQPTAAGKAEQAWMLDQLNALSRLKQDRFGGQDADGSLVGLLTRLTESFRGETASGGTPASN